MRDFVCLHKGWRCTCERRLGHSHLDMEIQENCKSDFSHKKTKYTLVLQFSFSPATSLVQAWAVLLPSWE